MILDKRNQVGEARLTLLEKSEANAGSTSPFPAKTDEFETPFGLSSSRFLRDFLGIAARMHGNTNAIARLAAKLFSKSAVLCSSGQGPWVDD